MYLVNKNLNLRPIITVLFLTIVTNIFAQNTVGLILNDQDQSFDGYTLFAPNLAKTTYLIDNDGNLINKWISKYIPGISAYLLEDGNLLRTAKIDDPNGGNLKGGFEIFDWDNNPIWSFYYGLQHHDVEYLPNGNVLMVVTDRQNSGPAIQAGRNPDLITDGNIRSTSILEINKTGDDSGEIVWQWNAWDHLIQEFDPAQDNYGVVAEHPELIDINFAKDGGADWLHTNSVAYNEEFDQIILSNRGTSEVWIIDHSTTTEQASSHEGGNSGKGGDLLYRWGNPIVYGAGTEADQKLFGQHDAHWIAPGLEGKRNILIFSNGWPNRGFSSIEEIIPPVDGNGNYALTVGNAYEPSAQLWTYTTPTQTDFNSQRFGGSQRLPNGNTLICNADKGEFFELTPTEEIVWKYQNPVDGDNILNQGNQPVGNLQTFRCYKYAQDYSGFDGRDLKAGQPLKVNDEISEITKFKLYDNYPNPFNPITNIMFTISKQEFVTIIIYDILGNKVKTLLNKIMEPGMKSINWDSKDDSNRMVSSGLYFYSIQVGDFIQTKKMLLLR